jgi:antitoxin component YwqK of YwqJK toxin-antitoxin module
MSTAISKDGEFKEYYPNGKVHKRYHNKNGKMHGIYLEYNSMDILEIERHYINGIPHGMETRWGYLGHDKKSSECIYVNGNKDGIETEWWPNGHIRKQCTYKKGKLQGTLKLFYEDGKQQLEYTYKKNKINGVCMEWSKIGRLTLDCVLDSVSARLVDGPLGLEYLP